MSFGLALGLYIGVGIVLTILRILVIKGDME